MEREKEREMARFEQGLREKERERKHELEIAQLKLQAKSSLGSPNGSRENLNEDSTVKSSVLKLVAKFDEDKVSEYFVVFEKLMERVKVPKTMWMLYLQSVLCGRAMSVYSLLSADDSQDYDVVKETVLNAYKLVPEAYRRKFRNLKKEEASTYVE